MILEIIRFYLFYILTFLSTGFGFVPIFIKGNFSKCSKLLIHIQELIEPGKNLKHVNIWGCETPCSYSSKTQVPVIYNTYRFVGTH